MKKQKAAELKKELRKQVANVKKSFSASQLQTLSEEVISTLELTDVFQRAQLVLVYHSLPDEVHTHGLIKEYVRDKQFLLPVVHNNELILRKYTTTEELMVSNYGIKEPTGEIFSNYDKIDLVIVPGVAFDRKLNRMGRGKGFYDTLLPHLNAPKVGIAFDFQLFDQIPADDRDVKMNMVVCQNEIVVE